MHPEERDPQQAAASNIFCCYFFFPPFFTPKPQTTPLALPSHRIPAVSYSSVFLYSRSLPLFPPLPPPSPSFQAKTNKRGLCAPSPPSSRRRTIEVQNCQKTDCQKYIFKQFLLSILSSPPHPPFPLALSARSLSPPKKNRTNKSIAHSPAAIRLSSPPPFFSLLLKKNQGLLSAH